MAEQSKRANDQLLQEIQKRDYEIKNLPRWAMVGTVKKRVAIKDLPTDLREHIQTMNDIMTRSIVRSLKFPDDGWDLWSEHEINCPSVVCEDIVALYVGWGNIDVFLHLDVTKGSVDDV